MFQVRCECGTLLKVLHGNYSNLNDEFELKVESCDVCSEKAANMAQADGFREGHQAGYVEGYDDSQDDKLQGDEA